MSPVTSPSNLLASLAAILLYLASPSGAAGAATESRPDSENGRYTLSPTADGFIRLDTRTGTVSTCRVNGKGWACYAVPDERRAMDDEIGRLQAENVRLRGELASRDGGGRTEDAPKTGGQAAPKTEEERRLEIPLPSDHDIDRVMAFVERVWQRLIDMANRMQQKDPSGKI